MPEIPLEITCQAVQARLAANEPFSFVDCREPDECAIAKIAGANLIPMSALAERVAELEAHKSGPVVVHCHHGGRSLRVVRWLRSQGYAQALSMAGGIDEWSQTIDPTVPRY